MTPWLSSNYSVTEVWNVTERARREVPLENPADDAALGVWLVRAPWMHPAWEWHYAALIHLRDVPGQSKAPVRSLPNATHEFIVFAVDPDSPPDLDAPALKPLAFLHPVSIVQQFMAVHDAAALQRVEEGLAFASTGVMTLDSDGRQAWKYYLLGKIHT